MTDYNRMGMVDPSGRFHSTDGLSHPDWAHQNRALVGFVGTKNEDYEPAAGDDACYDRDDRIALDLFKDEGWIRVKPNQGVELGGTGEDDALSPIVKAILRSIARDNPGGILYVDDGDGSKYVRVDMRGRPDFSEIEGKVERAGHRFPG